MFCACMEGKQNELDKIKLEGWDPDLRTFSAAAYRSSCTHWYGHGYLQCNDTVLYDRKISIFRK